jgi:hypothetical protein
MARPVKRSRHLVGARDVIEKKLKALRSWQERSKVLDCLSDSIYNSKETVRTFEENKLLVLGIRIWLNNYLRLVEYGFDIRVVTWTLIDSEVAKGHKVKREHITDLRKTFFGTGDILIGQVSTL